MIKMTAINEPEMVEFFNDGRFGGELGGYIAAGESGTLGTLLYRQNKDNTEILTIDTDDLEVAEGLLRATIFKTLHSGALTFSDKSIIIWGEGFSLEKDRAYNIEEFFSRRCASGCEKCKQSCTEAV